MDKDQKKLILRKLKGCKTFELFKNIYDGFDDVCKVYAQCWWICKQYQYCRDKDKVNKLKNICEIYSFDLQAIIEFSKTNLKHNDLDMHLANIIKLNKKLVIECKKRLKKFYYFSNLLHFKRRFVTI